MTLGAQAATQGFAGTVAFDSRPIDRRIETILTDVVARLSNGRAITHRGDGIFLVQGISSVGGGEYGNPGPLTGGNVRMPFAAFTRLDNRDELGAALGLTSRELARTPDSSLILHTIERRGDAGVAGLLGAFSFALWETDRNRLTLGRDCLGNRPLFYYCGQGFVVFATTLKALFALPSVPREIDEFALAHFMAATHGDPRDTFYRGIKRVLGRTLVTIDRTGMRERYYWTPDFDTPPPYRREDDYIGRARELFDQAVAAAIRDTPAVAIATSGGLDSSAIAATAARLQLADKITCFSLVPPAGTQIDVGPGRYLDERDKVAALARMHTALDVRFIAPASLHAFDEDDTRYFARTNLSVSGPTDLGAFNHLYDAVAAERHRSLLVGNQGNFGLTWGGNFSLIALLRSGAWSTFARELRASARQSRCGLARTAARDLLMPLAPTALRRFLHRLRGRDPDSVAHYSALNPAFIAEFELARQWRTQGFDPWFGPRGWNAARHRAKFLFDRMQLGRDIRGMAPEIHGFESRDPHGDRRLLEFLLSVPEPMYRQHGVPRAFARRVLADRLPREILDERRRGVQVPTWFRSLDAKRPDIARDIERLDASPLARRLIDLPRLKRLLAQWPKDEHAAEQRMMEYRLALARGVHVGRFVRWVEGGNA